MKALQWIWAEWQLHTPWPYAVELESKVVCSPVNIYINIRAVVCQLTTISRMKRHHNRRHTVCAPVVIFGENTVCESSCVDIWLGHNMEMPGYMWGKPLHLSIPFTKGYWCRALMFAFMLACWTPKNCRWFQTRYPSSDVPVMIFVWTMMHRCIMGVLDNP